MKTARGRTLAGVVSALVFAGMLATNFVVAQTASQPTPAQLQSLISSASSSFAYSQGVVALAQSKGLNVAPDIQLLGTGNLSLTAAKTALSSDLTGAGVVDARWAMGNFSEAAANASASIQSAHLAPSFDIEASAATVAGLNASALSASSAIDQTCAETGVSSSETGLFVKDCSDAKSLIANATVQLTAASNLISAVNAGTPDTNTGGFSEIVTQAGADISMADANLTTAASLTYVARGQAFVKGPLATEYAAANSSVELQTKYLSQLSSDISTFQAFLPVQKSIADGIAGSASALAATESSVPTASLSSSIASQQSTLTGVVSNLDSFSSQLGSLPLPSGTISTLEGDATSTETSASSYDSALETLGLVTGAFASQTPSGFSSYTSTFAADDANAATAGASFSTSLAALQGELSTVTGEFPLLTVLSTWEATFSQAGSNVGSGESQVISAAQSANSGMETVGGDVIALTSSVGEATQVDFGNILIGNVTAISFAEGDFLNVTALTSFANASYTLQSALVDAQSFVSSSQALLDTSLGSFSYDPMGYGASAMTAEANSAATSMANASAFLSSDLAARSNAVSSAQSLVSQATAAFGEGQVAQGATFLTEASAQFTSASSVS